MPAARVPLTLPAPLEGLFCPACGAVVLGDEGPAEEGCDHVRFLIDRTGELSLAEPESLAGDDRRQQEEIVMLVEETESWEEFLDRVVKVLPPSAMILELTEPVEDGDEDEGSTTVIAFDFAAGRLD
jgi:hypothetical protein